MQKILTPQKPRCIRWAAHPSPRRGRCRGQQGAVIKGGLPAIGRYWLGVEAKRSAFAPGASPARATGPAARRTTNGSVGATPGRSPQRWSRDRPRRAALHPYARVMQPRVDRAVLTSLVSPIDGGSTVTKPHCLAPDDGYRPPLSSRYEERARAGGNCAPCSGKGIHVNGSSRRALSNHTAHLVQ
jgi:hypothetical protein